MYFLSSRLCALCEPEKFLSHMMATMCWFRADNPKKMLHIVDETPVAEEWALDELLLNARSNNFTASGLHQDQTETLCVH